ncbi:glycosyl transferase family 1 [Pacificimonas flava]|uniref:Glycosyl transferase family 1 n=2 Tax=Pacificimonas TaxID=1960290 RepID=A0A219B8X0_9SPHN|nr:MULTISPECIES: glycosyltransferase family 1 protein [Pacificimonas]MBZ6377837.1 glycosyltransferase family 1 protein [Pacificimonas aurantium]OWV34603.1 glycosyl transferase family 1 [Pacificimonas flava]
MQPKDLRVALFSGNYNYVKDGANQALNRLTGYMLSRGVTMRIYSPTIDNPPFEPTGDLVSIKSVPVPGRDEYRFGFGLIGAHDDLAAFKPNLVHISSPDVIGHRAAVWAERHGVPLVASVHTRFETYFRYYKLGWLQSAGEAILRRLYNKCEEIYAPSESMADVLREQGMNREVLIWSRGIDQQLYDPARRDMAWRRSLGLADDDVVILFVGRLVLEKGLDVFAATLKELDRRGQSYKALFVGDGPAREWIEERAPQGIFTGFLGGEKLARAYASADVMFNPSSTETFGNVTLEAMASGLPVVAARATGSTSLVEEGLNGMLTAPDDVQQSADALQHYLNDAEARRRAGAAGAERAEAYDWDAINEGLLQRYLAVAGGHGS